MGCCGAISKNDFKVDIVKRDNFINNFFKKNLELEEPEERTGIFIKNQKKKIYISKDSIKIDSEIILMLKSDDPTTYSDNFWILMDGIVKDLKSKEISIDDKKVDDSNFEINNYNIKINYDKIFNNQTRKINIIQKIEKPLLNYDFHKLILKYSSLVQFLIYSSDSILIDDITNKKFILDKELNLAYFEGKLTNDTKIVEHGYINYSRQIYYQIYKYIPEFIKKEEEIITNKYNNEEKKIVFLAKYKKINITDYGQDVEEIIKIKFINYPGGTWCTAISYGLMIDKKSEVELVELNGKKTDYSNENFSIQINNINASNNQFAEIHLKYKYFTNEDKLILRQESFLTGNTKNTYCNIILEIPDKYVVLSSKNIFQKNLKKNNQYFYNGIYNEEELNELFKFCYKKASWDIEQEFTLEAKDNIENCTFEISKIFKGGNLKENGYEIINANGEFIDDEKENKYIFNFKDLKTNKIYVAIKLKAENSTSDYKVLENKEFITTIPEEDKQFFKDLSNKIINEDKTDKPIYKKLGDWVFNYLKYDLDYYGKTFTAKEIYNNKAGICKHFTLLFNTLLVSQGIEAINVSGYSLKITENNIMQEDEITKRIPCEPNTLTSSKHGWTLAKINKEWIPLDSTWNMLDKNVPVTHIFQGYGDITYCVRSNSNNEVKYKITKEIIKYMKN